ncbi:unnamed protein product [Schistosoma margrebowiei]|uniref:Uncharacterized protein n=1 Tax=Schistosoma margrebowiei TaxID=48269 RepID=A0A183M1D0_9TREM|nr:unnamed protein product [Schistosoma margrebowiei]
MMTVMTATMTVTTMTRIFLDILMFNKFRTLLLMFYNRLTITAITAIAFRYANFPLVFLIIIIIIIIVTTTTTTVAAITATIIVVTTVATTATTTSTIIIT